MKAHTNETEVSPAAASAAVAVDDVAWGKPVPLPLQQLVRDDQVFFCAFVLV